MLSNLIGMSKGIDKEIRLAIIDKDKCKPKKCAHECKKACPINGAGKKCIEIEDVAKISDELCIGCNMCVKKCPFNAIKMVKIPSHIANDLVHSYGENLFKLFKLPTPKLGYIIGILGPNGCGKSTIMNILSKKILPNFGDDDKKIEQKDILAKVRGTELHKYLTKLYNNELRINVKPQDIVSLVKNLKDTLKVSDILDKYKASPNYTKVVTTLDLDKIMNSIAVTLSGGELQKVTNAIILLKPGDVYIFDEPTNYLDVEYRIKVANLIKDISGEDKYVFVVEHDLSILDFVADYIHIMYGEPAAYGCTSTIHSVLDGINMYFLSLIHI